MRQRSKTGGTDSLIGQVIDGRYRLGQRIGQGGMGVVYEAEHIGLDKRVAVKFLLEKYTEDDEALERFRREARTASRIGHDNIVDITDIGETDGRAYIVMEFLEGADLSRIIRTEGQLPVERALAIADQVLRGLGAAHDKGIVHRDMKPENVFLCPRAGREIVKIMDFGISKIIDAHDSKVRLTETGVVVGTPIYMAPEQAQAIPNITHRADLYAVGCMLFELLAGRPPFEGNHYLGLVTQHLYEQPPSLATLRPDVPPNVQAAIERALAKEPDARWDSAATFARALQAVDTGAATVLAAPTVDTHAPVRTDGRPAVSAAPTTAGTHGVGRRSRAPYYMVGGAALLAIAMVAFAFVSARKTSSGHAATEGAPAEPAPPVEPAVTAPADDPAVTPLPAGLEIDSTPRGATVFIDGQQRGITPLSLEDVAIGKHEIRLELDGHRPLTQSKEIRAGYRETFVAAMAPEGSDRRSTGESGGRITVPARRRTDPAPIKKLDAEPIEKREAKPIKKLDAEPIEKRETRPVENEPPPVKKPDPAPIDRKNNPYVK